MSSVNNPKNLRKYHAMPLRRLWDHLGKHKRPYIIGTIMAAADAATQACVPMVFRSVVNHLETDADNYFNSGAIWISVGIAALLTCVFFVSALMSHVLRQISLVRFARDLQQRLYQHVQRLSADFFQRHRVGEIAARTGGDVEAIRLSLSSIGGLLYKSVMLIMSVSMMFWISWRLTPVFIVLMIVMVIIARLYLPRIKRLSREYRNAVGQANATITELLGIHELIRSFSGERLATRRVEQHIDDSRKQAERLAWQTSIFADSLQALMAFIGPFILLFTAGWLITQQKLTVGDLVAYWSYWLIMGGMMHAFLGTVTTFTTGLASIERVYEFLDEEPLIQDDPLAAALQNVKGRVTFDQVHFNYPTDSDQSVLNGVSFEIPAGHTAAFVGPSGAGKSTILQLVMRFYDPLSGHVRIDGQNVRQISQASLRASIGMVMQESVFFSGTIAQNLRFVKPDATRQQMVEALQSANAWSFVQDFPDQLETVIGERGARLSGGQKQRLSIARVFLKDPPIVIFDEATSALDSISEKLVQTAMQKLMAGRTTLVVAHRIATVKQADEIFIVEDGKISASGPHNELIEQSPLYYELYTHQSR